MSCHCLFFLCLGFLLFEKDTFPGKSPDEVAVEYQELKEPATKTNDQLIKMCVYESAMGGIYCLICKALIALGGVNLPNRASRKCMNCIYEENQFE